MWISYDAKINAAYIGVVDVIEPGTSVTQVPVSSPVGDSDFILDFDAEGRLVGIDVMGATRGLRPNTLASARRHG